ncbi:MAG: reactive intermediate/imine deaminase [Spirochaetes bacterium]|nr:MAG: reactive intermediate/imine deaminase [Spirochaetota bacterium]
MKKIITSVTAPPAIGPYSQGTEAGGLIFLSGQLGLDPASKAFAGSTAESQAEQALKNIGAVLEAAGVGYANVVKATVLLTDIADFPSVNAVYAKYFSADFPARSTYAVKALPLGALVEIEVVAYRG